MDEKNPYDPPNPEPPLVVPAAATVAMPAASMPLPVAPTMTPPSIPESSVPTTPAESIPAAPGADTPVAPPTAEAAIPNVPSSEQPTPIATAPPAEVPRSTPASVGLGASFKPTAHTGPAAPPPGPTVSTEPYVERPEEEVETDIIEVLRSCYDPEIPVNIYDLGLIYDIRMDEEHHVNVKMTLTSPMCPVAGTLPPEVQYKVSRVSGVRSSKVDVVWEPTWTQDMMGEAAKIKLGLDL